MQQDEELVPVERKSRYVSSVGPYEGELLQLAAYCLLVEERVDKPVHRGQLQFLNGSIEVPFDDDFRGRLLDALAALQECDSMGDVRRSHNRPARCRGCGFREICEDAAANRT